MFRDGLKKLGYCNRSGMTEFAKPINMVSAVQQCLQESCFSIRYLYQKPVNQMYVFSYRLTLSEMRC